MQLVIQRDFGVHLAFIFETDVGVVQNLHRLARHLGAFGHGIAEVGKGHHGDARLLAQMTDLGGGLDGGVGQLLGVGHDVDGGVRQEHRAPLRHQQRQA